MLSNKARLRTSCSGAAAFALASLRAKAGARCRFRTCDPYRVKVMLYH